MSKPPVPSAYRRPRFRITPVHGACIAAALGVALVSAWIDVSSSGAHPIATQPASDARAAPRPNAHAVIASTGARGSDAVELAARVAQLESSDSEQWDALAQREPADEPAGPPAGEAAATEAVVATMTSQLDHERADPAWSPEAERVITASIDVASGTHITALDCRATLCRLEVQHDSELARDRYTTAVLPSLPLSSEMFFRHTEDARGTRTVTYISRPGHALPRPRS